MCISARRTSWAAWRCSKARRWRRATTALAQLVLEEKVGALAGDRVILRDPSATRTIAGGSGDRSLRAAAQPPPARRLAELDALRRARRRRCCPGCWRWSAGFVDLARFGQARNLRPVDVDKLLPAAGGTRARGLRLPRRDAGRGARRLRRHAEGPSRGQARRAGPAAGAAAAHPEAALAAGRVQGAARPGDRGQEDRGRRRLPAPARPFADARRARRGAVAEDLGRARRASASSRRACATSPSAYGVPEAEMRQLLQRARQARPRRRGGARPVLPAARWWPR